MQAHAENYSQDADEDWARVGYQSVAHPEEGRPDSAKVRCMLVCQNMGDFKHNQAQCASESTQSPTGLQGQNLLELQVQDRWRLAAQEAEGGGEGKDRLINAIGSRQGGPQSEDAAEAPGSNAQPECHSQDQFFEELLRLPPPVGRSRCSNFA